MFVEEVLGLPYDELDVDEIDWFEDRGDSP